MQVSGPAQVTNMLTGGVIDGPEKLGHGVLDAVEEILAEPEEPNHSVTVPPVPTESRRPFITSLSAPLADSAFEGAKAPTSTMLCSV